MPKIFAGFFFLLLPVVVLAQGDAALQTLAAQFFAWRAVIQPATGDDIPRVERPPDWRPDFSPAAIEANRARYREFRSALDALDRSAWSRSDSVDFLLLRSAIERVNYELNVLRAPQRNPDFYVHQTLGAVFELLLINSPMTAQRASGILLRLQSIPQTLQDAQANLTEPVGPFADIALANLGNISDRMKALSTALQPLFPARLQKALRSASGKAAAALDAYRTWLESHRSQMTASFNIGREGYVYFLNNIALIPYSPEELLAQGRLEWNRSVAFETYEKLRNAALPEDDIFPSAEAQVEQEKIDEQAIRDFLEEKGIMSVPDWLQHYLNVKTPAHLSPVAMGVMDDLTSATRLDEDAVRYIAEPRPDLPYFQLSSAKDPRPLIIHEGVPGHYFQMARSWRNPDPIRRHFIDSGANEGIGFYVEELMLQFGLFDNRPHTREIIYNFMRLRALRVEVDIQLALGQFTIPDAGDFLARSVPMDRQTAVQEAGFFAYNPGQAISYQIGKLQILRFLSDARVQLGDQFELRAFHDYLMDNGNVPIALLRWEYLGLSDEIKPFFQ